MVTAPNKPRLWLVIATEVPLKTSVDIIWSDLTVDQRVGLLFRHWAAQEDYTLTVQEQRDAAAECGYKVSALAVFYHSDKMYLKVENGKRVLTQFGIDWWNETGQSACAEALAILGWKE